MDHRYCDSDRCDRFPVQGDDSNLQTQLSPCTNPAGHPGDEVVKDIRRATRKQNYADLNIRVVIDVLKGEGRIPNLCRREGIAQSFKRTWSEVFLQAGKGRLDSETSRATNSKPIGEIKRTRFGHRCLPHHRSLLLRKIPE